MLWAYEFIDNKAIWAPQETYTQKIVTQVTQEILLWTNENPMSILSGVNYKGVFDLEVFLRQEITQILEQYDSIDYHMIEEASIENDTLTIKIVVSINNELISKTMQLQNKGA